MEAESCACGVRRGAVVRGRRIYLRQNAGPGARGVRSHAIIHRGATSRCRGTGEPSATLTIAMRGIVEDNRAGGTMFDAFFGNHLEAVGEWTIEWSGDLDIKSATDEGESQRFGGLFGEVNANAAEDAFARLEQDAGRMVNLLKTAALSGKAVGIGAV